jgi:hypothetical protein
VVVVTQPPTSGYLFVRCSLCSLNASQTSTPKPGGFPNDLTDSRSPWSEVGRTAAAMRPGWQVAVGGEMSMLENGSEQGVCSREVLRDRRSRSTGAEGEEPQAPSNRSVASHE